MALLETRNLTVRYGGLHANDSIDLDVEPGKLVGLIGPNGAGKTTFIDAITGFTPLSLGTVTFDGARSRRQRPDERAHLGLSRTFQSLELFEDLSVRDNLLVAPSDRAGTRSSLDILFRRPRRACVSRAGRPGARHRWS